MKLKTCILPLLLLLLISYYVSATTAETSKDEKKEANKEEEPKEINQSGRGGGRSVCRYGCCGRWRGNFCSRCCMSANEMEETKTEEESTEIEPEQSGRRSCRYGCCGGYTRFGCRACCRSAKESDVAAEKDEHVMAQGGRTGGGGWGGGCRYGCCGHRYGKCYKCCHSNAEAQAYDDNEAQP